MGAGPHCKNVIQRILVEFVPKSLGDDRAELRGVSLCGQHAKLVARVDPSKLLVPLAGKVALSFSAFAQAAFEILHNGQVRK